MPDWSAGYVADIAYTYGTYAELNPHRARLAFLLAGLTPPKVVNACELGFGQGISVNVHAAASGVNWYGTDFNPSQAGFAQELADASGAAAHLYDQAFAEFCARDDLPDFDFIGLHGIFSWISDENRRVIVDFIRRKLKVGGVLYISYNTQPGWTAMAPVRDLMSDYANVMGVPGSGSLARVDQSIAFIDRLFATDPLFLKANPNARGRFEKAKGMNRAYLAHEYFNQHWVPFSFTQIAKWLEPAKVSFACSAHYLDHIDAINLTQDQAKLLSEIDDPVFAQTVRDYIVNQAFRRDYWVRGPRKLGAIERNDLLMNTRVALMTPRADVPLKTTGALGEVTLHSQVYDPLLDLLADGHPQTIGELAASLAQTHQIAAAQVLQAITVLTGMGQVAALQADDVVAHAAPQAQRLNLHLAELAISNTEIGYAAAPATGGPIGVDRLQLMFLLARARGGAGPEQWAAFAHAALVRQGQRVVVDGKPVESDEQQLHELVNRAVRFRDNMLPRLIRLGAAG
jgi:SAM-dependent methyltransferase